MCNLVAEGNLELIRRLVLTVEDDLSTLSDYDFRTPLHIAATKNRLEIAQYLVNRGVKVNAKDRWGITPLYDAVVHKHKKMVKYLVNCGASIGLTGMELALFLNKLVMEQDIEQLQLLVSTGLSVNVADYDERTPLHVAGDLGLTHIYSYLVAQCKADTEAQDVWGQKPVLRKNQNLGTAEK